MARVGKGKRRGDTGKKRGKKRWMRRKGKGEEQNKAKMEGETRRKGRRELMKGKRGEIIRGIKMGGGKGKGRKSR